MFQVAEPMLIQALVPKSAVEALHKGILHRFSRLYESEPYLTFGAPFGQALAHEFRTIVGDQFLRQAPVLNDLFQHSDNPFARQGR